MLLTDYEGDFPGQIEHWPKIGSLLLVKVESETFIWTRGPQPDSHLPETAICHLLVLITGGEQGQPHEQ